MSKLGYTVKSYSIEKVLQHPIWVYLDHMVDIEYSSIDWKEIYASVLDKMYETAMIGIYSEEDVESVITPIKELFDEAMKDCKSVTVKNFFVGLDRHNRVTIILSYIKGDT